MAVVNSIDMLFGNVGKQQVDYKVALSSTDETKAQADYLWEKLSDRNKVGISTEFDTNTNLIPCKLSSNKIVLSPNDSEEEPTVATSNIIVIDSYHIIESTSQLPLSAAKTTVDFICFPFQLAIGQIKSILIHQAQASGQKLSGVYIAIYANDVPGLTGARLIWSSMGDSQFTDDGLLSFYNSETGECTGPQIPGYTEVNGTQKPNTFFYILFSAFGMSDGGYKLLGYKNSGGFELLSGIGSTTSIGLVKGISIDEAFHETFDYTVEVDYDSLIIPYIAVEMIV